LKSFLTEGNEEEIEERKNMFTILPDFEPVETVKPEETENKEE